MLFRPILSESKGNSHEYIFCPSKNCLNVPEIEYSFNPIKQDILYKCKCHNNSEQKLVMNLHDFLEKSKSNIICDYCKSTTKDDKFSICHDCNNIFHIKCKDNHIKDFNHFNFSFESIYNINNICKEHKEPFIYRCQNCNESICYQCIPFHYKNRHTTKEMFLYYINDKEFDKINHDFNTQKEILEIIKRNNNNLFTSLENDIKIKQKIISNYNEGSSNYNSIVNLKNLYLKNNEKYEIILRDLLNKKDKKENNENYIDKYLDKILSVFYYLLMIINDESLVNNLLSKMEQKIIKLNKLRKQDFNNYNDSKKNEKEKNDDENKENNNEEIKEKNNNENKEEKYNNKNYNKKNYNKENNNNENINKNNYNILQSSDNKKSNNIFYNKNCSKGSSNINPLNINNDLINQKDEVIININNIKKSENDSINSINQEVSFNQIKNIMNTDNIKEKNYINATYKNKNKNIKSFSSDEIKKKVLTSKLKKNIIKNKIKKIINDNDSIEEKENQKEKNNDNMEEEDDDDEDNNFISNIVALKSGNFAISKNNKVKIYDFRKLDYSQKSKFFKNELIKKCKCLLQNINFIKDSEEQFISYIYQFPDESLLCSINSKIIRIKLINNDKSHEIIGYIKLEDQELPRKLISLGNSFLVILSEKENDCNIKIYEKDNNSQIIHESNSIQEGLKKNNINQNNDKAKFDFILNGLLEKNKVENTNLYIQNIKEDSNFKLVVDNFNEKEMLWVSLFEINKNFNKIIKGNYNINYHNNSYEFISTSNKSFTFGKDKVNIYEFNKDNNEKYGVRVIKEINKISCSAETDSICQINEKYLCIGLQDYDLEEQQSGFALVNIITGKVDVIKDDQINCIYYGRENSLLMASMEIIIKRYRYYYTKIYKIKFKKDTQNNDLIDFDKIYEHRNEQVDTITSINKIPNEKLIFITSSQIGDLEVVRVKN